MANTQFIESTKNPKVKQFKKWRDKSRERKKDSVFVAEGLQECQMAFEAQYEIDFVVFCEELIAEQKVLEIIPEVSNARYISCTLEVFNELAMRKGVENLILIARQKNHSLDQVKVGQTASYLICDAIEKPGNLGAIARSAHALGMDAVILSNPLCDIYNPNTVRSSTGSIFSIPVYFGTEKEVQDMLDLNKIETFVTHMYSEAKMLTKIDVPQKSAWVIGTENSGLNDSWLNKGYTNILIPMKGNVDSLNVSNAAAIIMYEVARQRN